MRKLLQWLMIFCSLVCWGQQQDMQFTKIWGSSDNYAHNELHFADQRPNGDYVVIGAKMSDTLGGREYYFARLDSAGQIDFEVMWGNGNYYNTISQVIEVGNGEYLMCGHSVNTFGDFVVTLINDSGEIQFNRFFHFSSDDIANAVTPTPDSCFILCGAANIGGNEYPAFVKIDRNGNEIWRKSFPSLTGYNPTLICSTLDTGFVVCGDDAVLNESYCARYDKYGNAVWTTSHFVLNSSFNATAISVRSNADSTIDVLYRCYYPPSTSGPSGSFKSILYHCNQNGDSLQAYGFYDDITAVFRVDSSRFHVIANRRDYMIVNSYMNLEAVVLGTDHYPDYFIRTRDGGFFAAGRAEFYTSTNSHAKFQVTKYGSSGNYYAWPFMDNVNIYPIPSIDGSLNLSFDVQTDSNVEILLWSTTGVLVKTNSIFCPANSNTIMPVLSEGDVLASGSYILEIRAGDQSYRQIVIIGNTTLKEN